MATNLRGGSWCNLPMMTSCMTPGSALSSMLDQKPPLSEVCEYARTSSWYKLGIQLEVDEVELKEIRDDTGSDKRTLMYQLWLRTQPNATRRQLLTALRTKDVGEEVVASKYEQMLFNMVSSIIHFLLVIYSNQFS